MNCVRHEERGALAACAECGDLVCAACRRLDPDGLTRCPDCTEAEEEPPEASPELTAEPADALVTVESGAQLAVLGDEPPTGEDAPAEAAGDLDVVAVTGQVPIAWEHPEAHGDLAAFRATVANAVLGPIQFMNRIPWVRGDLRTPLVFAILCGVVGYVGMVLVGTLVTPVIPLAPSLPGMGSLPSSVRWLIIMPLLPITLAGALLLQSAIAHALLAAVGATRRPFEATFRVFCYANAASLFMVIPVAGPHIGVMFTVLLVLSGMRAAHQTTFATGLLALTPMFLAQLAMPLQ